MSLILIHTPTTTINPDFYSNIVLLESFNGAINKPLVGGYWFGFGANSRVVNFPVAGNRALNIQTASDSYLSQSASVSYYLGDTFNIEFDMLLPTLPSAALPYSVFRPIIIGTNDQTTAFCIQVSSAGSIACGVPKTGKVGLVSDDAVVVAGQWAKFAFSRYEGTMRIFKDGQIIKQGLCDVQSASASQPFRLGYDPNPPVNGRHPFYLRNLRVLKGHPGKISPYTPIFDTYTLSTP